MDDGSTDTTASIAEAAGVRAIRTEHRGLSAARNAGIAATSGEIVAFIDADARADRDWLYHLTEAIVRRGAAAAGGPNLAPPIGSESAAAMAAAPGIPREVRSAGDELSQLCGCNMAIARGALERVGGFDDAFTAAGDDVDLSWRMAAAGETLVHAPGAVVIHERRATLGAYVRQQIGYGEGEGHLYRKYPNRAAAGDGMYGSAARLGALIGGARVYYGEFGRGLFQSAYSSGASILEVPLSIQWIGISVTFAILAGISRPLGFLGRAGLAIAILAAAARAFATALPPAQSGAAARIRLWAVNLLGPPLRSLARERIKWRFAPDGARERPPTALTLSGRIELVPAITLGSVDAARLLVSLHDALTKREMTVSATDGFQSYDLEIIVPPLVRVPINALRRKDGSVDLVWRTRIAARRALAVTAFTAIVSSVAGASVGGSIFAVTCVALAAGLIALRRIRLLPGLIDAALRDAAAKSAGTIR